MIELTQKEKDFLIKHKNLLQQNNMTQLFQSMPDIDVESSEHITQFLVDRLGNKIFRYFEFIPTNAFWEIDLSKACPDGVLELPKHIKKIGMQAFLGSKGYHTLVLPIYDIDGSAFNDIRRLKTIIITNCNAKNFIEFSAGDIFADCNNVKDIRLSFSKEEWITAYNEYWNLSQPIGLEDADHEFINSVFGVSNIHCTVHWK